MSSQTEQQVKLDQAKMWLAISEASWVLWSLTNGKFHGVQCWAEDYRVTGCTLRLRRGPVEFVYSVETVHDCGKIVEPYTDWCLESANTISLCCHHPSHSRNQALFMPTTYSHGTYSCGCATNRVRVTYQIDNNLPPGTQGMVAYLACERSKAAAGKACSLPERVTSVTRQGVSWTLLDPQDFLAQGMTGVARLDQWLAVAKRGIGGSSSTRWPVYDCSRCRATAADSSATRTWLIRWRRRSTRRSVSALPAPPGRRTGTGHDRHRAVRVLGEELADLAR